MEYVYAAMILHSVGKPINEENITGILKAAGVEVDETRVKALVSALEGVDIDEAIKSHQMVTTAAASAPSEEKKEEAKEEEEEKEEEVSEEEALEGLGALFG
ncbi:MAG TPA: 50S ribosomal protein P1 [Methanomicrobia archaeon]|nr:50S ribosomal protein P1 [Methanomicrobia archaeon]